MKTGPILMIAGVDCEEGKEKEFNEWYNRNFPEIMLKAPGVVRVDRYQLMEDDDRMPKFISIVQLENEESFQAATKSEPMRQIAETLLNESTRWGLQVRWGVHYKRIYSSED